MKKDRNASEIQNGLCVQIFIRLWRSACYSGDKDAAMVK